MPSFLSSMSRLGRRRWEPLKFSNHNFVRIPTNQKIEEETIPNYIASRYYPTRIGEIFEDRYQVVGKLGFGATSTVWLARDMEYRRYVTLKIFIKSTSMGQQVDDELKMYKRMERASKYHPGRNAVRSLLDSFNIDGPEEKHRCLVHPPLWENVLTFLHRNPIRRLPSPILAVVLHRLFLGLDYLHTECQIIHTDIKANNIMFNIADDSVFSDFEERELQTPSPRKEVDGNTIYVSRELRMPKEMGPPVLCDFGSAMPGDIEHSEDIQPNIYRAPEVILEAPWTYSVDIWNVGCMIWDIFEGTSLFTGHDNEFQTYRSRAHLAEMISLLGTPPHSLLAQGKLSHKFFSNDGEFCPGVPIQDRVRIEERETALEGEDKARFLRLVQKMLQWEPSKRGSAKELAEDEWIHSNNIRSFSVTAIKCRHFLRRLLGFSRPTTNPHLKPDDLPQNIPNFDDGNESNPFNVGRNLALKVSNEPRLRCTELDGAGNVTLVNGEFKKSELIAKYGLLPRDLRKIDSSVLPHILIRHSAILISLLHLRVLIKSDRVLVFDAYGSTDTYTQSLFMYDLEGKLRQKEPASRAAWTSGALPYEFRALEAVLVSITSGLEAEFEGVREPVSRVLRALEEDIDRDKLRHLLVYSKRLGTFEQKARLVRDAIDDLLEADDDLTAMYLSERSKGIHRAEHDHQEVEMLLESYHKVCDEIVQASGNLVTNIRNTEEIVKAILDANRNSLMLLELKFSIGTLGMAAGTLFSALYGMNLKNFIEESDIGFGAVSVTCFALTAFVCTYGLIKLRKVQRVRMWGENGIQESYRGGLAVRSCPPPAPQSNWRSDSISPVFPGEERTQRLRRLRGASAPSAPTASPVAAAPNKMKSPRPKKELDRKKPVVQEPIQEDVVQDSSPLSSAAR
ncbi:magnesium ion transporter [Microsporum canis]